MHLSELMIGLVFLVVLTGIVISAAVLLRGRGRPVPPPEGVPKGTITRAPEPAEAVEDAPPQPKEQAPAPSLRDRLAKSRSFLSQRLAEAFGGGVDDDLGTRSKPC